ncbi:hypothetical protein AcW1_003379 [Taiwanofungus camphoratus]|nr:hypothetical protein AcW1_003379 [Antrodia cinnamomea]
MVYQLLVGSYTNEIYTLVFDPISSSLKLSSCLTVGYHPSWITPHPTDPSLIFTGLEQSDGKIIAVKYDKEGRGMVVGEAPSGGADPCTLLAVGEQLLVGNYTSGTFATIPLSLEPPYLHASQTTVAAFSGAGPNKERQEASHLHQVILHPGREEILIPDLGSDLTRRFTKGPSGAWVSSGGVIYKAGGGPRHVVIHDDVLYTLLELSNEVTAHQFPPLPKEPTLLACVSTMSKPPPPPALANMFAAEILSPTLNSTFPNPYVYVSNRNDPSPEGDTIAIYSITDPEKLELVAEVHSGLKHLRGMLFGGPDDKWLIAGGVNGPGVKMFERVDGGRGLEEIASLELAAPTGFLWI